MGLITVHTATRLIGPIYAPDGTVLYDPAPKIPPMLNYGGIPGMLGGTAANRPAAGTVGRLYFATNTGELSYDTGSAWVELNSLAGALTIGGVLTSNVATGTAPFAVTSTTQVANLNVAGFGGTLEVEVASFLTLQSGISFTYTTTSMLSDNIIAEIGIVNNNAQYYFEATMSNGTAGDTTNVGLWDISTGAIVANSAVSTTLGAAFTVRSSAITLVPPHRYTIAGWIGAGTGYVYTARIVAVI